ncbi:MAG: hypothetical protein RJA70_4406 [Pseudomonadota bacterium]|jgi:RNA polymerase sigma-70 factor (ECF subfamily)
MVVKRRSSEHTDDEIVRGIRDDQAWASKVLYERTFAVVLAALTRALGERPGDQDDLLQLAYERLIRSLKRGHFEGRAALTSWANIIASRVAIDAIRARIRDRKVHWWLEPNAPELVDFPSPEKLESRLEGRADMMRVLLALKWLRPEHARAVELHDFAGLDLNEVAQLMGVTVAAAQSRLVRGRKELSRVMKFRTVRSPD